MDTFCRSQLSLPFSSWILMPASTPEPAFSASSCACNHLAGCNKSTKKITTCQPSEPVQQYKQGHYDGKAPLECYRCMTWNSTAISVCVWACIITVEAGAQIFTGSLKFKSALNVWNAWVPLRLKNGTHWDCFKSLYPVKKKKSTCSVFLGTIHLQITVF